MNAVNLIPADTRSRGEGLKISPPTVALMGGLVIALIAAVLYVTASNTVATRKTELAQVTVGVAGWTAAANSYDSFVHLAAQRTQQLADVRQLAASRFPWSNLLGQIGGVMPRAAALTSLTATSAPSTSGTPGVTVPSVQLSGCAASQSVVAQTMVQLRLVKGVSDVTLSSSSDSGSTGSSSSDSSSSGSSAASQGSSGCAFPVQFQVALTFRTSSAATAASTAAGATTTSPSTPATTTTTPGAAQ
jgi:Tfp pilus assembly protein PilN